MTMCIGRESNSEGEEEDDGKRGRSWDREADS